MPKNKQPPDDGGPIFGIAMTKPDLGEGLPQQVAVCNLSLRQYAAIKLCVPRSGTDWLDEMILESLQDKFAGQALVGLLSEKGDEQHDAVAYRVWSKNAYMLADAMLAENRRRAEGGEPS